MISFLYFCCESCIMFLLVCSFHCSICAGL
nr:MAG TPA: hypothetical protein [Caudoviricetes sp.]DAZ31516.1 MAG TPA: hypothetical protein [Caudoviricetes sp.]